MLLFVRVRDELLDEKRVSARDLDDAAAHLPRQVEFEGVDERSRLRLGKALEGDRAPLEARSALHELGPCESQQKDRRSTRSICEVLDQVEEGRLGPVGVFEHDDERPAPSPGFEQLTHRREPLLHRGVAVVRPDQLLDAPSDQLRLLPVREHVARIAELAHHVCKWKPGDALAVRGALTDDDRCSAAEGADELPHDSRLADSRLADDGDQHGTALVRACSNADRSCASCSPRPMSGASSRLAIAGAPSTTPTSLHVPSAVPSLRRIGSSASTPTESRTRRCVAGPSRISPGGAASSSRFATPKAAPVAITPSAVESPTKTSPC